MQTGLFDAPKAPRPTGITGLRDYQEAALQAIRDGIERGVKRQLIVMATGLGKGHLLGHVPEVVGARRTLVLAHRVEIIEQLAKHLQRANPHMNIAFEQGDRCEATPHHDIVVASVPTLASEKRRICFQPDQFDLVMHDESHHVGATSHRNVLRYFRCHEPDGPLLVGYTATPFRGDKIKLADLFDEIVFDKGLRPSKGQESPIQEGWLCPVRAIRIRTKTDISTVKAHSGDFSAGQLEHEVNRADRNDLIASAIHEHAADRQTILVFAAGVEHAEALTARLAADGIETRTVIGSTPDLERRRIWRDFGGGRVRVVCNVGVATEGFDEPRIDCLVMARPTKSPLLFTQCLGRGMRTHPAKKDLLVLDVADVCGRHRVQTVSRVFGERDVDLLGQDAETAAATIARADELGIEFEDGTTIDAVSAEIQATEERIREAERREAERKSIRLALESAQVDLWDDPVAAERAAAFSQFRWLQAGRRYVLEVDRGTWAVIQQDGLAVWTIGLQVDGHAHQRAGENLTRAGAAVPDWVRADAFIKRYAGHWVPPDYHPRTPFDKGIPRWKFLQREAPRWAHLATPAQRKALAAWKIDVSDPFLNCGAAHDLIAIAVWNARHR